MTASGAAMIMTTTMTTRAACAPVMRRLTYAAPARRVVESQERVQMGQAGRVSSRWRCSCSNGGGKLKVFTGRGRRRSASVWPRVSLDRGGKTANDGDGEVGFEVRVERAGTLPGVHLEMTKERLRDFAASDAAVRAMLTGGPGRPKQLGPGLWRLKAPGFGGRLFFIGPVTELNPVSDFKLKLEEDGGILTVQMEQTKSVIEGTPPTVVEWINRAYRAERTVTTVVLDARKRTVVASLDLRVVVAVPKPFRIISEQQIEAAMKDAATKPVEVSLGKVCDAVAEAYGAWAERQGALI